MYVDTGKEVKGVNSESVGNSHTAEEYFPLFALESNVLCKIKCSLNIQRAC